MKTLCHIRQSTCLYLHSGSPEYEAQTLFVQPIRSIIKLIIFYTSWAKVPVTANYVCYQLPKTLKSALYVHCLSASFKSVVLIETYKTYSCCLYHFHHSWCFFFQVSQPRPNETSIFDGTAIFSRWHDAQYHETQVAVTIHRMEVFRMEFTYDSRRFVLLYVLHFCSFWLKLLS